MRLSEVIDKRRALWGRERSVERDRAFCDVAAREIVQDADMRREVRERPWLLIEACFTVVDKNGRTVPFFLNEVQRDFVSRIEQEGTSRPFLILKGRQQGFTTEITGIALASSVTTPNWFGMTITDCGDNTRSIFNDKARSVYDRLPRRLRPTEKFNSARELNFSELNSSWRAATASRDVARSKTLSFVHYSEAAFYKCELSDIQAAVGAACVDGALVIYETTANGFNAFRELWKSGTCVNIFYEWWRTPEYRSTEYEYLDKADAWLSERLKMLSDMGLDREQLTWYAKKYDGYLDKRMIRQEYPCTPDEAFLSTGKCIFDLDKLNAQMLRVERLLPPPTVGEFVYERVMETLKNERGEVVASTPVLKNIRFIEDKSGCIRIHEQPRVKRDEYGEITHRAPYVLGGDTAGEGSDFYTTKVLCNLDGRTAATLHRQRMDEDKYAEQVFCLGQYYHDALVALEINYSRAPTRHLQQLGYPNLYRREVMTGVADQTTLVPGFETNRATRPIILDELVGVMRDDTGSEVDLATLGEMMTFIRHKNGKKAADIGMHDDLVMARAIATHITAHQTRAWMPVPAKKNTFIEDNFRTRESERGEFMDWGD